MGEAAQTFGKGGVVDFEGQTYQISPFTLDDLAMFEVWCEQDAWGRVERCQGRVDPATYQRRLDATARVILSGAMAFGGDMALKLSRTEAGQRYLLFLALSRNEGMTEELSNRIFDHDRAAVIAKMNVANPPSDPNPTAPGAR